MTDDLHFADFTESGYRLALVEAKRHYRFEPFGTASVEPHVLWRHDVDLSVHRAARLADIETEEGVAATYFFFLHSAFYNLLERPVADLARKVIGVGDHRLGLHFDTSFSGKLGSADDLAERIAYEAGILGDLLEATVEAVSFHNPGALNDDLAFDNDQIVGLHNAYGRSVRERYGYVSDANGYWRFRRLIDVLTEGTEERLHVLTHPGWWQAEPMPPRARVVRCAEGRSARIMQDYDEQLARMDRQNVR